VLATISPTNQDTDMTSKVVLTNVLVLASGTKIEQDVENNKPISVSVVTLMVDPMESERLTLASTEGKIQLALRNPLDKTAPPTPGIQPPVLLGYQGARRPVAASRVAAAPPPPPTVEVIRGDKRSQEVLRQE
jgi:pilus assembly protein CpaB